MFSPIRTQRIPRTVARSFFRFNSASSHSARGFVIGKYLVTGVAGGVAGGGTVLVAGYAWYHYSGTKQAVDTFRPAMKFLGQVGDLLDKHSAPSLVLEYLQKAAKAYVAFIPGAGFLVDIGFNAISETVDTHAEAANAILYKTYIDILNVVMKGGNEHRIGSVFDIATITQNLVKDMKGLGIKVAQPISQSLEIEKHAAAVRTAAASVLEEINKLEIEKRVSTVATSARDEIKSRGPAVQESLSKISQTTGNWIEQHGPRLWGKVEAKVEAKPASGVTECPDHEANHTNTTKDDCGKETS